MQIQGNECFSVRKEIAKADSPNFPNLFFSDSFQNFSYCTIVQNDWNSSLRNIRGSPSIQIHICQICRQNYRSCRNQLKIKFANMKINFAAAFLSPDHGRAIYALIARVALIVCEPNNDCDQFADVSINLINSLINLPGTV